LIDLLLVTIEEVCVGDRMATALAADERGVGLVRQRTDGAQGIKKMRPKTRAKLKVTKAELQQEEEHEAVMGSRAHLRCDGSGRKPSCFLPVID
jgi:hypothetical protein